MSNWRPARMLGVRLHRRGRARFYRQVQTGWAIERVGCLCSIEEVWRPLPGRYSRMNIYAKLGICRWQLPNRSERVALMIEQRPGRERSMYSRLEEYSLPQLRFAGFKMPEHPDLGHSRWPLSSLSTARHRNFSFPDHDPAIPFLLEGFVRPFRRKLASLPIKPLSRAE